MSVKVYLVQHGEAKLESEDPQRPLSNRGRGEVSKIARYASNLGLEVTKIVHSGKLRAKQTAEILAEHLHPAGSLEEIKGLSPGDPPESARDFIENSWEPLMIVGHLPHLSKLLSILVIGNPETSLVQFRNGGIVTAEKVDGKWCVTWILTPDIVKG